MDKTTDENGLTTLLIADTGLLVTDADGDAVYTDKLYNSSTGSLSQYSITATHTVYYYYRYSFDGLTFYNEEVKAYKMTTTLNYGSVYGATLLEHYYWRPDAFDLPSEILVKKFDAPVEATPYTTYPSNVTTVEWIDSARDKWPGFGSVAKVYYGTKIMEIEININSNTVSDLDGNW